MTTTAIEKRLSALENQLAALQAVRTAAPAAKLHPVHALERIHATFENDAAFRQAMRLGRKSRNPQRPKARHRKTKAKRT